MAFDYGNYNDLYNLSLYLNTVDVNSDYMSFTDGVLLNGAIGAGLEGVKYGGKKAASIFSKNKPSKITKLREQVQLRNAVRGSTKFETFGNALRYNELKAYEAKLPKTQAVSSEKFAELKPKQQQKVRIQGHKARYYKNARRLLAEAKTLKGKAQAAKIKEFKQALAEAKLAAYKAKFTGNLRPTTLVGKSKNALKTVTGVRALNTGVKTLNAASPFIRTAGKLVRGNAAFAALSVAMDYDKFAAAKEVGGKKAMTKEIAKSTGVAAVEAVGFMAGMKAGAALGTAIGTVVPGVGNVVGGIAGAAIGALVSWGAGKIAHKALGCDTTEAEKISTKNAKLLALKAKYNSGTRLNLIRNAAQVLATDAKTIQEAEAKKVEVPMSPVVKRRMENAAQSLQNIAEDEPELIDALEQELAQAEQETEKN